MKKKVIIIGAGPAGITAAYELMKRKPDDYEIFVYEESDSIGGISKTVIYNGNRMDMGGHRFFSKDERVLRWWESIMPKQGKNSVDDLKFNRERKLSSGGPDPEKTDKVMLMRKRRSRILYNSNLFEYPIKTKKEFSANMGFGNAMKAWFGYVKSSFFKKKEENSLENFFINRFGHELYSMFFEEYAEKLLERHPKEISADCGAQLVKELPVETVVKNMFKNIKLSDSETDFIENFCYPKLGPGQLWENALDEFKNMGGKVFINCQAIRINTDGEGHVNSITISNNGAISDVEGDIFISSMPVKDLIKGMNDVPEDIKDIAEELPYRDFVMIGLLVDKLLLKNETSVQTIGDVIPDCWIYVQDKSAKLGRIQIFNNWSPYMVSDAENTVWLGLEYFCSEGDEFWNMSDEKCIDAAISELISMGIIDSRENVKDSHRERVKKAYPAYYDTYSEFDKVKDYLNKFENLYCVGRNGQHRCNNMDRSMITSFEAVKNIIGGVKTKDNIWNAETKK